MTSFPNSGDRTCSLRYFYTRREIGYSKAKHFNPKLLELDGNITLKYVMQTFRKKKKFNYKGKDSKENSWN